MDNNDNGQRPTERNTANHAREASNTRAASRGRPRRAARGARGRARGSRRNTRRGPNTDPIINVNDLVNITHARRRVHTDHPEQAANHPSHEYHHHQLDDVQTFNAITQSLQPAAQGKRRKRRPRKNNNRNRVHATRARPSTTFNNNNNYNSSSIDAGRRAIIDSDSPGCSSVDSDVAADYVRNLLEMEEEKEKEEEEEVYRESEADGAEKEAVVSCAARQQGVADAQQLVEYTTTSTPPNPGVVGGSATDTTTTTIVTKEEVANLDVDALENLCAYGAPSKYTREEIDLIWSGDLANYNDVVFRGAKPIAKNSSNNNKSLPQKEINNNRRNSGTRHIKSLYGKPVGDHNNKGFNMLLKMGWKQGQGLGVNQQGDTQPVSVHLQRGTSGLGRNSQKSE